MFNISIAVTQGPRNPPKPKKPLVTPINAPLAAGTTSPTNAYRVGKKMPDPMPVIKRKVRSDRYPAECPARIIPKDIIVRPIDIVIFFPILSDIYPPNMMNMDIAPENDVSSPPPPTSERPYSSITSGIITPIESLSIANIR